MSLVGQVDWYFQVTVCARETCGMATAAAPVKAAPARNLRRVAGLDLRDCSVVMGIALLRFLEFVGDLSEPLGDRTVRIGFLFRLSVACTGWHRPRQGTNCPAPLDTAARCRSEMIGLSSPQARRANTVSGGSCVNSSATPHAKIERCLIGWANRLT